MPASPFPAKTVCEAAERTADAIPESPAALRTSNLGMPIVLDERHGAVVAREDLSILAIPTYNPALGLKSAV